MIAFVVRKFGKDGKRRADILVTDEDGARALDFVVSNAAASSAASANRETGVVARRSVDEKQETHGEV